MNKVIYQKAKYTQTWGNSIQNNEINYRLLVDKCAAHQKKLLNLLLNFVVIYNKFITEKFPDTKDLWLIVNDNQTYNYKGVDTLDDIVDYETALNQLEQNIIYMESMIANGDKTGSAKNPINVVSGIFNGANAKWYGTSLYTSYSYSLASNGGRTTGNNVTNTSMLIGKNSPNLMDAISFKFRISDNVTQGKSIKFFRGFRVTLGDDTAWINPVNLSSTLEIKFL